MYSGSNDYLLVGRGFYELKNISAFFNSLNNDCLKVNLEISGGKRGINNRFKIEALDIIMRIFCF